MVDNTDIEQFSRQLFGRFHALSVLEAIAKLSKDAFASREVGALCDVPAPQLSKELARLELTGLIQSTSRRGDFERRSSSLWAAVLNLVEEIGRSGP